MLVMLSAQLKGGSARQTCSLRMPASNKTGRRRTLLRIQMGMPVEVAGASRRRAAEAASSVGLCNAPELSFCDDLQTILYPHISTQALSQPAALRKSGSGSSSSFTQQALRPSPSRSRPACISLGRRIPPCPRRWPFKIEWAGLDP